jgi:hypothetical protein
MLNLIFAALLGSTSPQPVVVHITQDFGGDVDTYIAKYERLALSGTSIEIDGECTSACGLVFSHFPRDRVCVTPRAVFGLHQAWVWRPGHPHIEEDRNIEADPAFTANMIAAYPPVVRGWVKAHGPLVLEPKYMPASALHGYFKECAA